jgi:hypothetical protein
MRAGEAIENIETVLDPTEVGHARRVPHPHVFAFDDFRRGVARRVVHKSQLVDLRVLSRCRLPLVDLAPMPL